MRHVTYTCMHALKALTDQHLSMQCLFFSISAKDILDICPLRASSVSGERACRQTGSLLVMGEGGGGGHSDEVEIIYV